MKLNVTEIKNDFMKNRIEFEEMGLLNIRKTGFSFIAVRVKRNMKHVKPEFKGMKELIMRSFLGFYNTEERVRIHVAFCMWEIKKQQWN